jgi:4-amino-4-deoxy-L-arabinose transferase-like glycosyltransferase
VRSLLNQHSFLLLALITLVAVWLIGRRLGRRARLVGVVVVVAAAVAAFALLRTGDGALGSVVELDHALAGGQPVVLEVYSDY